MSYDHKTQVGGTHYSQGDLPQHWDLVCMYGWDYFQGQIIKYLMRWKVKYTDPHKRLEDLKKARNFLDKYIAEEENKLGPSQAGTSAAVPLDQGSNDWWTNEGYYGGDNTALYKCRSCGALTRLLAAPSGPHMCGHG